MIECKINHEAAEVTAYDYSVEAIDYRMLPKRATLQLTFKNIEPEMAFAHWRHDESILVEIETLMIIGILRVKPVDLWRYNNGLEDLTQINYVVVGDPVWKNK